MLSVSVYRIVFWLLLVAVLILSLVSVCDTKQLFVGQDKFFHMLAYSGLYALLIQAYQNKFSLWLLAACLLTFGLLVEVLQYFSGYREAEIWDFVANTLGVLMVAGVTKYLKTRG